MDEDALQTKLSLEPPYRNDDGKSIPVTYEILPTGEYIYEPCVLGIGHSPILIHA